IEGGSADSREPPRDRTLPFAARQQAQVFNLEPELEVRHEDLHGPARDRLKTGTQHFVAAPHLVEAAPERLLVELTLELDGCRDVLPAAALAFHLLQEPEPLLRKRQLQPVALGQPLDRLLDRGDALTQLSLDTMGKPGHGRALEQ